MIEIVFGFLLLALVHWLLFAAGPWLGLALIAILVAGAWPVWRTRRGN